MKFLTPMFTCLLLVVCCGSPVAADLVINFSIDDGASFSDSFDVETGDVLNVGVFLQQTLPDTVLTDEGIVSWGLDLTVASALGTILNAEVNGLLFDVESRDVTTATGFEWEYGSGTEVTGDSVLLGAFQFETTADGESVFVVGDRLVGTGVGNASWLTAGFSTLDEQIFGDGAVESFQLSINSVSAVPEPSSCSVVLGVACLAVGKRRRRSVER